MVIRVQMIRPDTRHPNKLLRHPSRAWCQVAGHRFETQGPAPIYNRRGRSVTYRDLVRGTSIDIRFR